MFQKIMVPVDLTHPDKTSKAISVAAELARTHGAHVTAVGVSSEEPCPLAASPAIYAEKLSAFAAVATRETGVPVSAHPIVSHDPSVDLNCRLVRACNDLEADLVVMACHAPGEADQMFTSHGSYLANHARASVFLVR